MERLLSLFCEVHCPRNITAGSRITARVEIFDAEDTFGYGSNKIRAVLMLFTDDDYNHEESIPTILPLSQP